MAEPLWGQRNNEKRTRTPEQESVLDSQLEFLLLKHAQKINEGNNGIIFRLDLNELREVSFPELQSALQGVGISLDDQQVVKILKVYKPGAGRREFEMQQRAFTLVQANEATLAKIPKPVFFREISLTETGQKFMETKGARGDLKKVELLLMDYISGIDLAVYLYREVVKTHPALAEYAEQVDNLDFWSLQGLISRALKFSAPSVRATVLADRAFEQDKVFNENEEILYKYLEKRGFVFPPEITAQFRETMKLFHRNKFFWRDGHHRNFMITEDQETHKQRGAIVDFGSAVQLSDTESASDVYNDGIKKYVHDDAVLAVLQRFSATPQEKKKGVTEMRLRDLEKLAERVEKNPANSVVWTKFSNNLLESNRPFAEIFSESLKQIKNLRMAMNEEMRVSMWLIFLQEAIKQNKSSVAEVHELIENYLKSGLAELVWQNKLVQDIKLFE